MMNALFVDWLSRRHTFSLIPASAAADSMVLPTCILMKLPFFILLLIGSVCRTSCVEVCNNMSPGDSGSPHSLVVDTIMRLHKVSLTFTNFFGLIHQGYCWHIFLFHIPECFHILFKLGLSGGFTVPRILAFLSTVVAGNVIQISPGYLILLFFVSLAVPSFPALRKHEMVDDPVGLIISIGVIIKLIV